MWMRLVGIAIGLGAAASVVAAAPASATTPTSATISAATKPTNPTKPTKPTKPKATKATKAKSSKPRVSRHIAPVPDATDTPAYRYAQLSPDDCEAELTARAIPFAREPVAGALDAVRLGGPLHGVEFRTELSDRARATSPYELADCRLVLALDDFAAQLALHDIVTVTHYSIYRPPPKGWPDGKIGIQHIGALSIDAAKFVTKDGRELVVDRDFHGAIGARTCGPDAAPHPVTAAATELRAILCDAVAAHLFTVVLTPNHNRPHHNHFHLEVMAAVTWFLVD